MALIKNCTLYFPIEKPPLKEVFPAGRTDGGVFKAATWFDFDSDAGPVRLVLQHANLSEHLRGFRAYVAQLQNGGKSRAEAQALIKATKSAVGVILPNPVAHDSVVMEALLSTLHRFGGFMFVADSIMLPDGNFVVGPMAKRDEPGPESESDLRKVDPAEFKHQGAIEGMDSERIEKREKIYCQLAERGFKCARRLPLYRGDDKQDILRPLEEIAARLLALNALFLLVSAPDNIAATDRLQAFVDRNELLGHLTAAERAIFSLKRSEANSAHSATIGWRLENMWALSWILGFDPAPPFFQGQIPSEITRSMIMGFLPNLDATIGHFLQSTHSRSRTPEEVGAQEDLYYCVHNAVRSAQLGSDTVPHNFHPVRDGGAIHERRHVFTWAMSPNQTWEETDLST